MINDIMIGNVFDIITKIPDTSVDLVVTSPPYFQQRVYTDSIDEIGREETVESYLNKLYEVFTECVRITKNTGSIIFNIGDKYVNSNLFLIPWRFALLVNKCDVKLINQIMWVKTNPTPRQFVKRMVSSTEPFFHYVKTKNYKYYYNRLLNKLETKVKDNSKVGNSYFKSIEKSDLTIEQKRLAMKELNAAIDEVKKGEIVSLRMKIKGKHSLPYGGQEGGRKSQIEKKGFTIIKIPGNGMVKDVFCCSVESIRNSEHPAIYPLGIIEKLITLTTDENDLVFDPFMGSGTTAIACIKTKRNYSGIELNPKFADKTRKRIKNTIIKL